MTLQNKGLHIDKFYIPPFTLNKGELVIIYLYGGAHYNDLRVKLTNIFTGKTKHENVFINKQLTFIEHFEESRFRRTFYPMSVREYLKNNANTKHDMARKVYNLLSVTENTKVKNLARHEVKLLNLYSTFTKTNDIVFDLGGVGPGMDLKVCRVVTDHIKHDGSALLIDWTNSLKSYCSKFITVEVVP